MSVAYVHIYLWDASTLLPEFQLDISEPYKTCINNSHLQFKKYGLHDHIDTGHGLTSDHIHTLSSMNPVIIVSIAMTMITKSNSNDLLYQH